MKPKPNNLITLREVADILGIAYQTARHWHSQGRLPAPVRVYSVKSKRWDRGEIERFGTVEKEISNKENKA